MLNEKGAIFYCGKNNLDQLYFHPLLDKNRWQFYFDFNVTVSLLMLIFYPNDYYLLPVVWAATAIVVLTQPRNHDVKNLDMNTSFIPLTCFKQEHITSLSMHNGRFMVKNTEGEHIFGSDKINLLDSNRDKTILKVENGTKLRFFMKHNEHKTKYVFEYPHEFNIENREKKFVDLLEQTCREEYNQELLATDKGNLRSALKRGHYNDIQFFYADSDSKYSENKKLELSPKL